MNPTSSNGKRPRVSEAGERSIELGRSVKRERLSPDLSSQGGPSQQRGVRNDVVAPDSSLKSNIEFRVRQIKMQMDVEQLPPSILKYLEAHPKKVLDMDLRDFHRVLDFYRDKKISPRTPEEDLVSLRNVAKYLKDTKILAELKEILPLRKAAHASKGTIDYPSNLELLADKLERLGDSEEGKKKRDRAQKFLGRKILSVPASQVNIGAAIESNAAASGAAHGYQFLRPEASPVPRGAEPQSVIEVAAQRLMVLSADEVKKLSDQEVRSLPASAFENVSHDLLAAIRFRMSDEQRSHLLNKRNDLPQAYNTLHRLLQKSSYEDNSLSENMVAKLYFDKSIAFDRKELLSNVMSPSHRNLIGRDLLPEVPAEMMKHFGQDNLSLRYRLIHLLSVDQLNALQPVVMQRLTPLQLKELTQAQLEGVDLKQFDKFSAYDFKTFSTRQIEILDARTKGMEKNKPGVLSSEELRNLTFSQVKSFDMSTYRLPTLAQFKAFPVHLLSKTQLHSFRENHRSFASDDILQRIRLDRIG